MENVLDGKGSVEDYEKAGIRGVTEDNISEVNNAVSDADLSEDPDVSEVQKVVNEALEDESSNQTTYPDDLENTSGGVLQLDLGVVNLDLLSAEQIQSLRKDNPQNIHEVTVEDNHELDGTVTVTNRSLLGGVKFNVEVFKGTEGSEAEDDYTKVQSFEGSSGGALGMANTLEFELDTLEEGKYEIILSPEEGLSLLNGVEFNIEDQVLRETSGNS